jgi:hypothetical protein
MADWLCSGLQIRVSRFDSGFRLQIFYLYQLVFIQVPPVARVVKLVDTRDLKSLVRKDVPVQVRPRAPFAFYVFKKHVSNV